MDELSYFSYFSRTHERKSQVFRRASAHLKKFFLPTHPNHPVCPTNLPPIPKQYPPSCLPPKIFKSLIFRWAPPLYENMSNKCSTQRVCSPNLYIVYPPIYLSTRLLVCQLLHLSVRLSVGPLVGQSVRPSSHWSVPPLGPTSVGLSVHPSVGQSIRQSVKYKFFCNGVLYTSDPCPLTR